MFGLTDIENRFVVASGREGGEGMGWEFGISRRKSLSIERMSSKVLPYSSGNYKAILSIP